MLKKKLVFVILLVTLMEANVQQTGTIKTLTGSITGSILTTQKGGMYTAYRGIRYAKAPVGELRFKPPVPIVNWTGQYVATRNRASCPQLSSVQFEMSEDCLFLNVYTKGMIGGNAPVIFFIHGGANVAGSGNSEFYGPEYLMDTNIVLVTINYRLGALGFLSTGRDDCPGNNAYKDQVVALQWVRDNIKKFGGNPNLVTIVGESAGGWATSLHLASPMSRGLFHRAIVMSGSTTSHHFIDNQMSTMELAKALSCPIYHSNNTLACLRSASWKDIIAVNLTWDFEIEKESNASFITAHPTMYFLNGTFTRVPILAGITKDEFIYDFDYLLKVPGLLDDINANFNDYAPKILRYDPKLENADEISGKIRKFYFGDKNISAETIRNFGEMRSDAEISHSVHRLVQLAKQYVDVFYYRFDYIGRYSRIKGQKAVVHADDLQYLFVFKEISPQLENSDPEMKIVDRVTNWWTSFAENGYPATVDDIQWLPSKKGRLRVMYIDNITSQLSRVEPFNDRYLLWDDLFPVTGGVGTITTNALGLLMVIFLRTLISKFVDKI